MIATLAMIRDCDDQQVGQVQASRNGPNFTVRIVCDSEKWGEKFGEIDQDMLRLMLDGRVYLERRNPDGKEFVPLGELVRQFSGGDLRLAYDLAGIEQGHQLTTEAAREQDSYVPFADLLEILRESSQIR